MSVGTEWRPLPRGKLSKEEQTVLDNCLRALRELQAELSHQLGPPIEIFEFEPITKLDYENPIDHNLEKIVRWCSWWGVALRMELRFKLLYSIDGYLSAVEAKNPSSTFLLARYLLELAATVSAIDLQLEESVQIDLHKWIARADRFMATLWRARYATSDERIKAHFAKSNIAPALTKPFHIGEAIKRLTARPHFEWAHSKYGQFSNICHHNGSAHFYFKDRFRVATAVDVRSGGTVFMNEPTPVLAIKYPVSGLDIESLTATGKAAWWCAHSTNRMIEDLPESPFDDKEIRKLTRGQLSRIPIADVSVGLKRSSLKGKAHNPGRNDPCPCGSGKKYKLCCGTKWH
jgi:hypothetical protein